MGRQFAAVIWAKGKPPLDSELNLMSQRDWEALRQVVSSMMPSGFFMDPTRSGNDFQFDPLWADRFVFGNPRTPVGAHEAAETQPVVWAAVNGWVIPVCGSGVDVEGDLYNVIRLNPPPESDTRLDFVFLEAWQARVDPNPSTSNKPAADRIYKYGNVLYGGTNLTDDLEDPTLGFTTTARVQVQYRIRVVGGGGALGVSPALDVYPDGLDDPHVLGQGTSGSPVAGFVFSNMRATLGDPSLWRAGDGNPDNSLGTIDGYVYAIPICAIFRRSSQVYTAVMQSGNPTQNGAFCRTPGNKWMPDPLAGSRVLSQATLKNALSATAAMSPLADAEVELVGLNGSGLEDAHHTMESTFLLLDGEIVSLKSVNIAAGKITIPAGFRGRYGTAAVGHAAETPVRFFNSRPDGLYSDQIAGTDLLDMRRAVNSLDWDFGRLLTHNVAALLKGALRTSWKKSATGDTQGPVVHEVDYLYAHGAEPPAPPQHTKAIDGPDGIRMVWSDAAALQPDLTVFLDNEATPDNNYVGMTNEDTFEATAVWDVNPDFHVSGFMNVGPVPSSNIYNGTTFLYFLGGRTGEEGIRGTFRTSGTRAARMVTPTEWWKTGYPVVDPRNGNQHPFTLRFVFEDGSAFEPAPPGLQAEDPRKAGRHVGPMYPWRETNFERPFIVLGGLLWTNGRVVGVTAAHLVTHVGPPEYSEIDVGINFDTDGAFARQVGGVLLENESLDPNEVSAPLLRQSRTLYDMLTAGGTDRSGKASEVYVVVYGDNADRNNNGAFKVVGVGTIGYTNLPCTAPTKIRVEALGPDFVAFNSATGRQVVVEFRSQYHNADDTSTYDTKVADVAVVLTDIGGLTEHPWKREYLGYGAGDGYDLSMPFNGIHAAIPAKVLTSLTLMYHPGHGGEARVPDQIDRFALRGGSTVQTTNAYLRQNRAALDPTFSAYSGAPTDETFWDAAHVQLWNRLSALGWHAPDAPDYGGNVVGYTEQDRDHELFFDRGSKTLIFRPFRDMAMTLQAMTYSVLSTLPGTPGLLGPYIYREGTAKDGLQMFTGDPGSEATTRKRMGFVVPREFMPRFGRQDIPYYVDKNHGTGPFLSGVNHLFRDSASTADPVFNIIGGKATTSGVPGVNSMFFLTGMNAVTVTYGAPGTTPVLTQSRSFIGARKTTSISPAIPFAQNVIDALAAVNSSDFGRGLKGIQLPPCYGIARLYGVYDSRDFVTKGGRTFQANRADPETDAAPNLLREDACQQTLFILQDGAQDWTTPIGAGEPSLGDHTYVVPFNAIDIRRALQYVEGDLPEDYHFVVECSVFGFARGFINQNNLVLVRKFSGTGFSFDGNPLGNTDGDDPQIEGIHMVLPFAAGQNHQCYVAYDRTAYQGDPFMTRQIGTKTSSDYEVRYGELSVDAQFALRIPIQQYDADGNYVPQTPNVRPLEVLASMDFYTTMGTGKVGGMLYPGTSLDVGHTEDNRYSARRYPASDPDDPMALSPRAKPWRIETRAFTEGQKTNSSRAVLDLQIFSNGQLNPGNEGTCTIVTIHCLDGSNVDLYAVKSANRAALHAPPYNVPYANMFTVDESQPTLASTGSVGFPMPHPPLVPGQNVTVSALVAGVAMGDVVAVNWSASNPPPPDYPDPAIQLDAWVSAPGEITVRAYNSWTPDVLEPLSATTPPSVIDINISGIAQNVAANTSQILLPVTGAPGTEFDFAGVALHDAVVIVDRETRPPADPLHFTAEVTNAGKITVTVHNGSSVASNVPDSRVLRVMVVKPAAYAAHSFGLGTHLVNFRVFRGSLGAGGGLASETCKSLAGIVMSHPTIARTVLARPHGDDRVTFMAIPVGAEGNRIAVSVANMDPVLNMNVSQILMFIGPWTNERVMLSMPNKVYLSGGTDLPMNGGDGTSQIHLTGMTERLPLGASLQDSDFLCENPLGDGASACKSSPTGPRPIQTPMPLTGGGEEYDRFLGEPGELLALCDGAISVLNFSAWRQDNPTGSRVYRLYRGGGSAFVLSGDNPGGPVDWVSETFPASVTPVLKGGVLVCRAMLVRNWYEEVTQNESQMTPGDEIQMVVVTNGILGNGQTREQGILLGGLTGPAGYGEGYAAADRFRIHGRAMFKGFSRAVPDPAGVQIAVYPDDIRG